MEIAKTKYQRSGLAGTVLFHGILLLLFIFLGLRTPLPLPEEQGIVVSLGDNTDGKGNLMASQPTDAEKVQVNPNSSASAGNPSANETEAITQDLEEAPSLPKVVKNNPPKLPKEPVKNPKESPVVNPKQSIVSTPVETPKEDPKPNITAMYSGKKNNTPNNSEGKGEGTNPGNMGVKDGDPTSNNPGTVSGTGSTGISYSLEGRGWKKKPEIFDKSQEFGTVIIEITVDRYGNVTNARGPGRGSTTNSLVLFNKAKEAALKSKFTENLGDIEERSGTITFKFKPE